MNTVEKSHRDLPDYWSCRVYGRPDATVCWGNQQRAGQRRASSTDGRTASHKTRRLCALTTNIFAWTTRTLAIVSVIVTLVGCATTRLTTHAVGNKPPLCQAQALPEIALVLWGTAWRENQKEVALREGMASRAISQFFNTSLCYSKVNVLKLAAGREAVGLSDAEALRFAASTGVQYEKVILVRVEELGPLLIIYPSPALWEGGTEVVLRVRVLNANTSALEADIAIHWKDSGAFVLKGTKTLEQDLQAALTSVFVGSLQSAK
jgi:hypothetical protein